MNVKYINPFINATLNTIERTVGSPADRLIPFLKKDEGISGDISGIINFSGEKLSGSVALSFPVNSALKVYEKILGDSAIEVNTAVQDCIGELVNNVADSAMKEFFELDSSFNISLPFIVIGKGQSINRESGFPVVAIPFKSDVGFSFTLEISISPSD